MAYGDIYLLSTNPARISRWNGTAWSTHAASLPTGATHVRDLAIDPNNGDILTIDDTTEAVYRWNGTAWSTEISVWPTAGVAEGITFDGDGNIVVGMTTGDGNGVFRWDGTQWNFVVSLGTNGYVRLDALADGSLLTLTSTTALWRINESGETPVWEQINDGQGSPAVPTGPTGPSAFAVNPNTADVIVWSATLSQFQAWNIDAWVPYPLSLPSGVTGNIQGLALDRRGDRPATRTKGEVLALGQSNRRIYRRRGTTWRIEALVPSTASSVRELTVDPGSGNIATASGNGPIYVWDGSDWSTIAIPTEVGSVWITGLSYDNDGNLHLCTVGFSSGNVLFHVWNGTAWAAEWDNAGLTTQRTDLWLGFTSDNKVRGFGREDRRIYQRNSDDNGWESASDQITLNDGRKQIDAFAVDQATNRGAVYNNDDLEEWDGTSWSDRLAAEHRPNFGTGLYENASNLFGLAFDTYTPVVHDPRFSKASGGPSMDAGLRVPLKWASSTTGPSAGALINRNTYGQVYIANDDTDKIEIWDGSTLSALIDYPVAGGIGGLCVDPSNGDILASMANARSIYRWNGSAWAVAYTEGDLSLPVNGQPIQDVAIDPTTGLLHVAQNPNGSPHATQVYRRNADLTWALLGHVPGSVVPAAHIGFGKDGVLYSNAYQNTGFVNRFGRYINGAWEDYAQEPPSSRGGAARGAAVTLNGDLLVGGNDGLGAPQQAYRWSGTDWITAIPRSARGGGGSTAANIAVDLYNAESEPFALQADIGGIRSEPDLTAELTFEKSTGGPETRFNMPRPAFRKSTGGITNRFDLIPEISLRADSGGVSMDVMLRGPLKWGSATGGVSAEASLGLFEWIRSAGGPSMAGELTPPMGWKKSTGGVSMEARMTRPLKWEAYAGGPSVELPLWIPPKINASTGRISADIGLYQPPPVVPAPDGVRAILQNHDTQVLVTWNPVRPRRGNITGYDISLDDGDGEVVTFTGRPDLSAVLPVSHGTIVVKVRGRTVTHIGEWSKPVPVVILRIRLDAQSSLVIGQWQLSQAAEENIELAPTALRKIIDIFLGVMRDYILGPISQVGDQLSVDKAEGVWLDYLGARVGLVRPESYNAALDDRFGFDQSGQPFDAHPFLGVETSETVSFPIADDIYRRIVKARGIAVLSDGNFWDFARAVRAIDSTASISDKQNMTVRVVTDNDFILRLADTLGALPRPAGVQLVIAPRGQFGYDESGVPFDQGPFA